MTDIYDNKSHWYACKREVLGRIKNIKSGDYSTFFDYSSDFWLALCISYFTLSKDYITEHAGDDRIKMAFEKLFDDNKDAKIEDAIKTFAESKGVLVEELTPQEKTSICVSDVDNYGIFVSDDYVSKFNSLGSDKFYSPLDVNNEGAFIRVFRNIVDHSCSKINIGNGSESIDINVNNVNYEIPINWLVSYTDAFCSPQRFFRQDGEKVPEKLSVDLIKDVTKGIEENGNVDFLSMLYDLYTGNMQTTKDPNSITDAQKQLDSNRGKLIETLLYVAGINMYVLNAQGNDGLNERLKALPSSDADKDEIRDIFNNMHFVHNSGKKTKLQTIRNCFAHSGRVLYDVNTDEVTLIDYKDNVESGVIITSLDNMLNFLSSSAFQKLNSTSVVSSDVVGVRQELEAMFDDTDKQDATAASHSTGMKK